MGIKRGTARSEGACRQAFLPVLRAGPCGRITRGKSCDSPGVGSNLPCPSPPFSPKPAWGEDRGAFPCTGASRAGPGATHPALLAWHPEAPVLPELGGAGRSPRDRGGQHEDLTRCGSGGGRSGGPAVHPAPGWPPCALPRRPASSEPGLQPREGVGECWDNGGGGAWSPEQGAQAQRGSAVMRAAVPTPPASLPRLIPGW